MGRAGEIRAVDQCSRRTGRHIPAVTTVGPQSQPKPHAMVFLVTDEDRD
jgi:hypothetical protein